LKQSNDDLNPPKKQEFIDHIFLFFFRGKYFSRIFLGAIRVAKKTKTKQLEAEDLEGGKKILWAWVIPMGKEDKNNKHKMLLTTPQNIQAHKKTKKRWT
jgi:hypothetical protein